MPPQQTLDIDLNLFQCWSSVADAGPTINQHWIIVSCLLDRADIAAGHRSTWKRTAVTRWLLTLQVFKTFFFVCVFVYIDNRLKYIDMYVLNFYLCFWGRTYHFKQVSNQDLYIIDAAKNNKILRDEKVQFRRFLVNSWKLSWQFHLYIN